MRTAWCRIVTALRRGGAWAAILTLVALEAPCVLAVDEFTIRDHDLPEVIDCAAHASVLVTIENTSGETWDSKSGYFLSYHWFDAAGQLIDWEGLRTPFPEPVADHARIRLRADLKTPDTTGVYLLQWDIVHEHVRWFLPQEQLPSEAIRLEVKCPHDIQIRARMPARLWAGEETEVELVIENLGSVTIGGAERFVAPHFATRAGKIVRWEGLRTPMPSLEAGHEVKLTARLRAPEDAGVYLVEWDLVHEGVRWFSNDDPDTSLTSLLVVLPGPDFPWLGTVVTALLLILVACPEILRWRGLGKLALSADLFWLGCVLITLQMAVLAEAKLFPGSAFAWLTLASTLSLLLLLSLLPGRQRPFVSFGCALVFGALLYGDVLHLRFFGDLATVATLRSSQQGVQIWESIVSLMRTGDLWPASSVVLGLVLVVAMRMRFGRKLSSARRFRSTSVIVFLIVTVATIWTVPHCMSRQVFKQVYRGQEIGVLNAHGVDLFETFGGALLDEGLTGEQLDEVRRFFDQRRVLRAGSGPFFGAARGMNLIMIQVESLQAFAPKLEIGGAAVMPTLQRWINDGLLLTNVFDQTREGRSSDSEILTQLSLLPADSGAAAFLYGENDFTGIAEILRQQTGYATLSAVPFDATFWNRHITHPGFGYEENLFAADFAPGERIGWGLNDCDFLLQMADRLTRLDQPFGAWLITLSLHHPFRGFPREHRVLDVGHWEGTPFGNYVHTMHFFDAALAAFEDRLIDAGLFENTVFVIWGDHDAGFEWTEEFASTLGFSADDAGWFLSQRVPLLIRAPAIPALRGRRDIAAGHMDVAPTVLGLLGIDAAQYAFIGRNLLGDCPEGVVLGEYDGWVGDQLIYLDRGPGLTRGECLDRWSLEAQPAEACSTGFAEARRMSEMSGLVLRFDLQARIQTWLSEHAGPSAPCSGE